jgi:hypothetical protein
MTTNLHKEAVLAVQAWCKKHKYILIKKPRHVHPQSFVVGYASSGCLIISKCWQDSEPQTKEWDEKYPLGIVNLFDDSLKAGDWCISAYVSTAGFGQQVAIPLTKKIKGKK